MDFLVDTGVMDMMYENRVTDELMILHEALKCSAFKYRHARG